MPSRFRHAYAAARPSGGGETPTAGAPSSPRRGGLLLLLGGLLGCASIPPGRAVVDDVSLTGAEQLDDDKVLEHLATKPSPRFIGLFPGLVYDYAVFDPTQLERDRQRIRRYYQARGYYHARVKAARVTKEGDDHVEVAFEVREGKPTNIATIALEGVAGLPAAVEKQTRDALTQKLGTPFDEAVFQSDEGALRTSLTDNGYAYATVKRDAFVNVETHRAELTYRIVPGPAATFGAISIEGLGELPADQLLAALDIEEGTPYSTKKLAEAEQDALQLGVFNAVIIAPQLKERSARVPLQVKVVVAKLRSVRIGGGARLDSLKSDIHASTVWQDRNFLGDMRTLTLDGRVGVVLYPLRTNNFVAPQHPLLEGKGRAELLQRGFIEKKTTGKVEVSAAAYPVLIDTDSDVDDTILGYGEPTASAGVERTFWRLQTSLRQHVKVEVPFTYRGTLDSNLQTLLIAYPELGLTLDLRDSRIHPSAGAFLSNVLQVGIFGDAIDVSVRPEVRGYIPLYRDRLTLAARVSVGFLFPFSYGDTVEGLLNDQSTTLSAEQVRDLQLMYFRGFFAGGPSSNRGYPQATISPHTFVPYLRGSASGASVSALCDPDSATFDAAVCSSPIGGRSLWEAALELRLRVVGPLLMAAFCDTADVAAGQLQLRFNHPHLSCGGGVRYDTPIGPIRLDVGYRIPGAQYPSDTDARIEGDPGLVFGAPIAISFGIGEAF